MTNLWDPTCEFEADVRRMARSIARGGTADPSLQDHAARCAQCRETLEIGTWMQDFASMSVSTRPLPDPKYLWWKARGVSVIFDCRFLIVD